jgi:pyruvate dehydrogenase E2 component (dihydrolipoamide acetyltransferase)
MPKLTDQMQEGHISEWLCSEGQTLYVGQPLFTVETDKAITEVPTDQAGILLKILVEAGLTVPIGAPVAWIGARDETISPTDQVKPVGVPASKKEEITIELSGNTTQANQDQAQVLASPVAKRLARELGIELKAIQEYIGHRHIGEADVRAYAENKQKAIPGSLIDKKPLTHSDDEFIFVEMNSLQRSMAARMIQSAAIPQFATAIDVDLTSLETLRGELLPGWEATYGFHLTLTHILAALVARALEKTPFLNSTWTREGIRLYRNVNLGVAMAVDRGLIVPVIHGANQLQLKEIASDLVRLRSLAESNRLLPYDLEGGTFTLTNVGMMNITLSIPMLNPPQAGILAVAARQPHLMLKNGRIKSIPIATVTLVADHRIVDGAMGATFLSRFNELVEKPWSALGEISGNNSTPTKD